MATVGTVTVSLPQLAQHIDHSLLHPTMTDVEVTAGLDVAKKYAVAAACVKPYNVPEAALALAGTPVRVCAVVGFPHGSSTTFSKIVEAADAVRAGAVEIDVVVNVGKVLSGDWDYVEHELTAVNATTVGSGGILKVIFENDFLQEEHIVRLCEICSRVGVAFVKTSTGYGFVKQPLSAGGGYNYRGATFPHLKLMKAHVADGVKVKAAGGIRTLDDFLHVVSLGVERVGLSVTVAILEEAKQRGIGEEATDVRFEIRGGSSGGI
jgi:deoxyribose-phosphate aldolase